MNSIEYTLHACLFVKSTGRLPNLFYEFLFGLLSFATVFFKHSYEAFRQVGVINKDSKNKFKKKNRSDIVSRENSITFF